MSYELINDNGVHVNMSVLTFSKLLELAYAMGWEAAGTIVTAGYEEDMTPQCDLSENMADSVRHMAGPVDISKEERKLSGYLNKSGQRVSAEDALCLSRTLERSLEYVRMVDVPGELDMPGMERDCIVRNAHIHYPAGDDSDPELINGEECSVSECRGYGPLRYFSGERRKLLFGFIYLCRGGGITIC